jgi:heme ABC exporter ATP-binding subunit CcmA
MCRARSIGPSMDATVHLRDAVSVIGRFPVLAGVDLDVGPGEVLLVRGPNGAGKTSLLRACAGLVPIVSGQAVVLGHDLRQDRRSVRRRVGLLSHTGSLYDDLTAEENVRFAARAAGRGGDVRAVLAEVGFEGRLAMTPVARLSTGQRRRVSIAALAARRPSLWLLDEPHNGLDADGRKVLDALVRRASSSGSTVIVASHESEGATALAGQMVEMAGGRITSATNREPLHVA